MSTLTKFICHHIERQGKGSSGVTTRKFMSQADQYEFVKRNFNSNVTESHNFSCLYLVIHSCDMGQLKSEES